jgi:hypothetical protein
MRSYTVFQFTQRAIENRSTCHAWHACRKLLTPAIAYRDAKYVYSEIYILSSTSTGEYHV